MYWAARYMLMASIIHCWWTQPWWKISSDPEAGSTLPAVLDCNRRCCDTRTARNWALWYTWIRFSRLFFANRKILSHKLKKTPHCWRRLSSSGFSFREFSRTQHYSLKLCINCQSSASHKIRFCDKFSKKNSIWYIFTMRTLFAHEKYLKNDWNVEWKIIVLKFVGEILFALEAFNNT